MAAPVWKWTYSILLAAQGLICLCSSSLSRWNIRSATLKPLRLGAQVSAGLNVPSLYDSACHCVLNYLALIFPSLLGLINCVVCLPSITAWRGSTESPQRDGCTFWGTCCKCQQNITLSVLVSLCFHTSVLYEDIYALAPVHNKRFTWAWWP